MLVLKFKNLLRAASLRAASLRAAKPVAEEGLRY